MTLHKSLRIVLGLIVLLAVVTGLTSLNHPIILKWLTGSARHHGKPMPATVYTNGQANDLIKVFYSDEPNSYLLSLAEYDSSGILKFIDIDLNEKSIGRPETTTKNDYDFIAGHLFQSETGTHFSPFQDNIKGIDFDPQLTFAGSQIKFTLPPNKLKLDSIRIILP